MSYHRYQTDAFVLNAAASGESNKVFTLFTRELGRVEAYAQGVRELKSKMRYGLQLHTHVYVELVQGKGMWRIVSAEPKTLDISDDKKTYALYVRILSLARNLVHGESSDPALFDEVKGALTFFALRPWNDAELRAFEALLVMRMLHILGYWADDGGEYAQFLAPQAWSRDLVHAFMPVHNVTVADINQALKETQL